MMMIAMFLRSTLVNVFVFFCIRCRQSFRNFLGVCVCEMQIIMVEQRTEFSAHRIVFVCQHSFRLN